MSVAVSRQKKSALTAGTVKGARVRPGRRTQKHKSNLILTVTRSICQGLPVIFWFGSPWIILGSVGAHENGAISDGRFLLQIAAALIAFGMATLYAYICDRKGWFLDE